MKRFILEQQLIPATLGIIFGNVIERFFNMFMVAFITPYLMGVNVYTSEINQFITVSIELFVIFILLYLFIQYILLPLLEDETDKKEEKMERWNQFMIDLHNRDQYSGV